MSASSKKKLRKEQEAALLTEKQLQQQKETKKLKIYTAVFVAVMVLVLAIFAYSIISKSIANAGIPQRLSTALEVNDNKLNAAQLNYYYIDEISNQYNTWYDMYGENTNMLLAYTNGLDVTKPLDEQFYDVDGKMTWGEYFANAGIAKATEIYAMCDEAKKAGHTLSEAEKETVESNLYTYSLYAQIYGYPDMETYLKTMYGKDATEKSFREYLELNALAQSYYNATADSLTYNDTNYRDHEKEHFNDFSNFTYASFPMSVSDFYGENATEEDKAKAIEDCKAAAEAVKNSAASTPEELDAAIKTISAYAETTKTSTKNENVAYSGITETIAKWVSEEGRKEGDLGVLPVNAKNEDGTETLTGYYLVVFQSREDNTFNLVNVRHILVKFQGGTSKDGQTVYTDAEKLKAKQEAEAILAKFNETGKTEADFTALVKDNSDDTGSVENGGLYEEVYPGQMVANFNDWCFDDDRVAGDCELVETEHGYHVMYFVGEADVTYRDYMIDNTLRQTDMDNWLKGLVDAAVLGKRNISKLELDHVIAPSTTY